MGIALYSCRTTRWSPRFVTGPRRLKRARAASSRTWVAHHWPMMFSYDCVIIPRIAVEYGRRSPPIENETETTRQWRTKPKRRRVPGLPMFRFLDSWWFLVLPFSFVYDCRLVSDILGAMTPTTVHQYNILFCTFFCCRSAYVGMYDGDFPRSAWCELLNRTSPPFSWAQCSRRERNEKDILLAPRAPGWRRFLSVFGRRLRVNCSVISHCITSIVPHSVIISTVRTSSCLGVLFPATSLSHSRLRKRRKSAGFRTLVTCVSLPSRDGDGTRDSTTETVDLIWKCLKPNQRQQCANREWSRVRKSKWR